MVARRPVNRGMLQVDIATCVLWLVLHLPQHQKNYYKMLVQFAAALQRLNLCRQCVGQELIQNAPQGSVCTPMECCSL